MDLRVEKALGLTDRGFNQPWFRISNPCSDIAYLYFNAMTGRQISAILYDVSGNEVRSFQARIPAGNNLALDIQGIRAGAYFLRVTADGFPSVSQKLIVQP